MQQSVAGIINHLTGGGGALKSHFCSYCPKKHLVFFHFNFFFSSEHTVMMLILVFSTHILILSSCPRGKFSSGVYRESGITFSTDWKQQCIWSSILISMWNFRQYSLFVYSKAQYLGTGNLWKHQSLLQQDAFNFWNLWTFQISFKN